MPAETKTSHLWSFIAGVTALAAFIGVIVATTEFGAKMWERYAEGYDTLPDSYPNELWRSAGEADFAWLVDDWCYTTLDGFASRFRVVGGALERQNIMSYPGDDVTAWEKTEVHISKKGNMLRVAYPDNDAWPEDFIRFKGERPAEFGENNRTVHDDGAVSAGEPRQVLSCTRCKVSRDGMTYNCT
ncbi:hypothetical protein sos41_27300 [Alphaproteobacteria bacterium SO-S41]|nr:hypothetical protein sos41_27300 [Alphaproteobacteria bacterium SO-S41]